ncbi:MAG: ATP-binding cassette domain-containing protein [Actinobacteria bacterium]|nr:ATP-binding cassette domain-containing protein [Actinomycetota bacterium]
MELCHRGCWDFESEAWSIYRSGVLNRWSNSNPELMTKPSTRLLTAAFLALGFVLFRLLYAISFTGASSGNILLNLPGIKLGGVFSHVELFGPIGDLGLANALQSAMPFAASILAFGVLSYFVGPELIAKRTLRSRSNFLKTLGIGLTVLPTLAEAAKRIFAAMNYRSTPKRYAVVPLLETAIERANAVSFELGSHSAVASAVNSVVISQPALGRQLGEPLVLGPSDALIVQGATGSGKTTLLRSLSARQLSSSRILENDIFGLSPKLQPSQVASLSRYVGQQPRDAFIDWRSQELAKPTAWLSEGEAVWSAVQNALAANPKLLVLDEPYAALDDKTCSLLNERLEAYRAAGGIVVIAEHDVSRIALSNTKSLPLAEQPTSQSVARNPVLVGHDLLIDFAGQRICQGELISLLGPNGIGKTTMLKAIYQQASTQKVPVRFVPERVEDFFIGQTLREEFELSDKLSKSKLGLTRTTFESLISLDESDLEIHPRDLSAGMKLVLALSIAIALKPQLLLIDEPVKGLDADARANMAEVLSCVQETGCAVVFATHDKQFAARANRSIELEKQVAR